MATEKVVNNTQTSLTSSATAGAATIAVAAAAPYDGQFRVLIDSEYMLCTSGGLTTTWTVTRGIEGTTAASHTNGSAVEVIFTEGGFKQLLADAVQKGTYASLPAAEKAGRLYFCTDSAYVFRDNGSSWDGWWNSWPCTPPVVANFAWSSHTSANETDAGGLIVLTRTDSTSVLQTKLMAAPATPYTITALFFVTGGNNQGDSFGLCWQDNASGKLEACRWYLTGTPSYAGAITTYSSPSAGVANNTDTTVTLYDLLGKALWMRINDNGTNHIFSVSADGFNWIVIRTSARTTYLSAGGDHIGFFTNMNNTVSVSLVSWVQT